MEQAKRIDALEGRIERVEDRLEVHGDRLDRHERSYEELRKQNERLNEKQIRLETFVESGFKRSEDQNNQILNALGRLQENQQKSHEQLVQMINQGDKENAKEAAEGDRRNAEAITNKRWDAKTLWITVLVCVIVAIPVIAGAWQKFG